MNCLNLLRLALVCKLSCILHTLFLWELPMVGGYRIFINSAVMIVDHLWSTLVCFLLKWVKLVPWVLWKFEIFYCLWLVQLFLGLLHCHLVIGSRVQLEEKFSEHFYNRTNEMKLSSLISLKQGCDESFLDYIKRFRDIKNRCCNLTNAKRYLFDLVLMVW